MSRIHEECFMRKRILCTMLLCFLVLLCGCRDWGVDAIKPDDLISRTIKDTVGDQFLYLGHKVYNETDIYDYSINNIDKQAIKSFIEGCNKSFSDDKKIIFFVSFHLSGGDSTMFDVSNYNDDGKVYDEAYYLRIRLIREYDEACNPELYSEIESIKELHVAKTIQDKADEMGIDWYEYWPELETIVVEED